MVGSGALYSFQVKNQRVGWDGKELVPNELSLSRPWRLGSV